MIDWPLSEGQEQLPTETPRTAYFNVDFDPELSDRLRLQQVVDKYRADFESAPAGEPLQLLMGYAYGVDKAGHKMGPNSEAVNAAVAEMDQLLFEIVGQVATTTLTQGSLLVSSSFMATAPPGEGQVLVALAVPATRLPAGPLQAGDRVLVVDTPAAGADPPSLPPNTIPATVVRIGETDANGITIVEGDVAMKIRHYLPTGRVGHIQIAGVPERHEPDIGEMNYPYLFQVIDAVSAQCGWDGWIGCEYRPSRGAVKGGTTAGLGWRPR